MRLERRLALFVCLLSAGSSCTGSDRALETTTPPPPCAIEFAEIGRVDGRKDKILLASASEQGLYYAAYFQGGRISDSGRATTIEFDAPEVRGDPAILAVAAVDDRRAWYSLRTIWHVDGLVAKKAQLPPGTTTDGIAGAAGQYWTWGQAPSGPVVLRLKSGRWEQVSFQLDRLERIGPVTVDAAGRAYMVVSQRVEPPTPSPGAFSDLVLRTRHSLWRFEGEGWVDISPPSSTLWLSVQAGRPNVVYALNIRPFALHRLDGDEWSTVDVGDVNLDEAVPGGGSVDADGRLWLGGFSLARGEKAQASARLWVLDGDSVRAVQLPPAARAAAIVSSVSTSAKGDVWIATEDRVFRGRCTVAGKG